MKTIDIHTQYGKLHVYKSGNGERCVLLLHGGGCDSAMLSWREVMEHFGERYTVYAPDLLGYGRSDFYKGISGEHFYDIHIACIRELTIQLKLDHYILVGLSMGGAIATGYALKYPMGLRRLFLVGTWGISPKIPCHSFINWYVHKTNLTVAQYRWMARSKKLARWAIAYSLIGNKEKITDVLVQEVWEACRGDKAGQSMQDYQRSSITSKGTIPFYGKRLAQLEVPVIFVIGEKDPLVPLQDVERAKEIVKDGKLYVLKKCKHWAVKERPQEFCEIVEREYRINEHSSH